MRAPAERGTAVERARLNGWDRRFRYYRAPPGPETITAWLGRFSGVDRDIAARVLDVVEVVSETRIQQGYRESLEQIPGWARQAAQRHGRWFFVGFGGVGESGLAMARTFREATNMTQNRYAHLFCSAAELPSKKLTAPDTVVFIDDFSGSGNQICSVWPTLDELVASEARCFLILTAATRRALAKIRECSSLTVACSFTIGEADNIFSEACHHFTAAEKAKLLGYCQKADAKNPKGFGDCGLVYVLSHKTPNNSIPVLHANHPRWKGLFPRHLNA